MLRSTWRGQKQHWLKGKPARPDGDQQIAALRGLQQDDLLAAWARWLVRVGSKLIHPPYPMGRAERCADVAHRTRGLGGHAMFEVRICCQRLPLGLRELLDSRFAALRTRFW